MMRNIIFLSYTLSSFHFFPTASWNLVSSTLVRLMMDNLAPEKEDKWKGPKKYKQIRLLLKVIHELDFLKIQNLCLWKNHVLWKAGAEINFRRKLFSEKINLGRRLISGGNQLWAEKSFCRKRVSAGEDFCRKRVSVGKE